MFPVTLNAYQFKCGSKDFIYDLKSRTIFESNCILNEIIKMAPFNTRDEISKELSKKFSEEMVKDNLKFIEETVDKGYFVYKKYNIEEIQSSINENKNGKDLMLVLTYKCNLNCIYCYERNGSLSCKEEMMSEKTAKESIDYWYDNLDPNEKYLKVTFYGGEALINKAVLKYSVDYINTLISNTDKKITYIIITNGTLVNDDVINVFKENNFQVNLSIDGGERIQNRNRPFFNGKDTFNIVKENIQKMINAGVNITAKVTLTHETISYFKQIIVDLWNMGLSDVSYSPVLTDKEELKIQKDDTECFVSQLKEISEIVYENIIDNNIKVVTNFMDDLVNINNKVSKVYSHCSYLDCKTLIFTPDRKIYNCDKVIGEDEYSIGNLEDKIDFRKIINRRQQYRCNEQCSNCINRNICGSGCLIERQKYKDYSNMLCKIRVSQLEESLKLYVRFYMYDKNFLNKLCKGGV